MKYSNQIKVQSYDDRGGGKKEREMGWFAGFVCKKCGWNRRDIIKLWIQVNYFTYLVKLTG